MRALGPVVLALVLASCGGGDSKPKVVCLRGDQGAEPPRPIGRVDHCPLIPASFRFAYLAAGGDRSDQRQEAAADALIARELLAQGALEAGVPPPTKAEVDRHIADGELYALGTRLPTETIYRDGVFDYQMFKRLAGQAGLSVESMVAEQGRELLAKAMRDRIGEPGLEAWLAERCQRLKAAGRISIEPELIARTDDNGAPLPTTYAPCARWSP